MGYGEVHKQNILFVTDTIPVLPSLPKLENDTIDCCYEILVLADLTDADEFKNDISAPIHFFAKTMTVTVHLQKFEGDWGDVALLDASSPFGDLLEQVREDDKAVGFRLEWRSVLDSLGSGAYRFRFDFGSGDIFSERFCLEHFTFHRADYSVRVTYRRNSTVGDKNQTVRRDFNGLDWVGQYRFKTARFGYTTGEWEQEVLQLNSGKRKSLSREFREQYILEIDKLPIELHDVFKYDICLSDSIKISDYNRRNKSGDFVEVSVQPVGGYSPNYNSAQPYLKVEFEDAYNNRRKLYDRPKF